MPVTADNVRDLLDRPPAQSLSDNTINANINRATRFVDSVKVSGASEEMVDDAILATSVWLTYGSYTEGIAQMVGNITSIENTKLRHYKEVAELFINQISREPVDLDMDNIMDADESLLGISPAAYSLTTSEAYGR